MESTLVKNYRDYSKVAIWKWLPNWDCYQMCVPNYLVRRPNMDTDKKLESRLDLTQHQVMRSMTENRKKIPSENSRYSRNPLLEQHCSPHQSRPHCKNGPKQMGQGMLRMAPRNKERRIMYIQYMVQQYIAVDVLTPERSVSFEQTLKKWRKLSVLLVFVCYMNGF